MRDLKRLQRTFSYSLSESDVKSLSTLDNDVLLDDLVLIKKLALESRGTFAHIS